jgi:hypothetical protein
LPINPTSATLYNPATTPPQSPTFPHVDAGRPAIDSSVCHLVGARRIDQPRTAAAAVSNSSSSSSNNNNNNGSGNTTDGGL